MSNAKRDIDKRDNGPLVPLEQWMGRTALPFVPRWMTANQVTAISGGAGMLAGLCYYLASFANVWFVAGALLALTQWWADNTDGHVARTRGQASPAGRFLDLFLDSCTFTALGVGIAFASYTRFEIVAVATLLCLVQYVLTVLWIALARIWPTLRLGLVTSVVGFGALLLSGFPGLAQLGLFSCVGLVTALLVTRWVLPELAPPLTEPPLLRTLAGWIPPSRSRSAAWRLGLYALTGVCAIWLGARGSQLWNDELAALSPIPERDQQLDENMRRDLQLPDVRHLVVASADSEQSALVAAESVGSPLIDLRGQVVGIATSDARAAGERSRAGFAIPIDRAKTMLRQALSSDTAQVRPAAAPTR